MNDAVSHVDSGKVRVAAISIAASVVGVLIGSLALVSEALHSAVDVVATVITWMVVRVSDRPADDEHHYGHGKLESLSALGVIALLYVLAGGVLVESVSRLREAAPPPTLSAVPFLVLLIDIAVNFWRARALHRAAHETHSQALAADALHFASDVLGSVAVIAGLVLTALGFWWGDSAAAIAVALMISVLGLRLARSTVETLLDRAPDGAAEKARAAIRSVAGVVDVERLRVRLVGATHFVDATVQVPRTYPIDRVHDIKRDAQAAVDASLAGADVTFTTVPVALSNESVRERIMVIARNSGLAIHHVTVHDVGGRLIVAIDLEVDGDMTLVAAHAIAHELERSIREEFGADVEVDTHIEPLEPELPFGVDSPPAFVAQIAALRGRDRHVRRAQCPRPQHRSRRDRQLSLPRRAVHERAEGARQCRSHRARAAARVPERQARHQPRRAATRLKSKRHAPFPLRTRSAGFLPWQIRIG